MILHFRSSIGSPQRSQVWTSSGTPDRVTGRPESAEGWLVTPSPSRGGGRAAIFKHRGGAAGAAAWESISNRRGAPARSRTLFCMDAEWSDPELLRAIFDETRIVRKPLTGIITGYHVLPYILVAPEHEHPARAVEIRGRIKVSPRLVIAAGGDGPTYGELFGERELMDRRLVARVFSFRYASRVALESEDLAIRRRDPAADSHLDRVLDELSRREVIDTGVIVSPDARFYPLSLARFIREILDQEFRE